MNIELQKRYDAELARHEQAITALCNERMVTFFGDEWDGTPLKLTFGMGTCYVEVNGEQVEDDDYEEIEALLRDLEDLTDNYRRACPESVEIKGRKKRK